MSDAPSSDDARKSMLESFGVWSGIGIQLALSVFAGLYGGQWLDAKLATSPVFFIVGVLVGMGAGFYNMVRLIQIQQKRQREREGGNNG
jgi:F0F1-type ATP synthase assembly protein I